MMNPLCENFELSVLSREGRATIYAKVGSGYKNIIYDNDNFQLSSPNPDQSEDHFG